MVDLAPHISTSKDENFDRNTIIARSLNTFLKNGPIPASFCFYFRHFLITISIIEKSIDGVLGITRGCRMVGADETTELWRPPSLNTFLPHLYGEVS